MAKNSTLKYFETSINNVKLGGFGQFDGNFELSLSSLTNECVYLKLKLHPLGGLLDYPTNAINYFLSARKPACKSAKTNLHLD